MPSVQMCDKATRVWCCRICLVLSISSVLLTMLFQIWSYYFSLVREMDTLSSATPQLSAILSVCNSTILTKWKVNCLVNGSHWNCDMPLIQDHLFVDSTCLDWQRLPLDSCCRVLFWILPW